MNEDFKIDLRPFIKNVGKSLPYQKIGKIHSSKGILYEVNLSKACIGSSVEFQTVYGTKSLGEVVNINGSKCLVMPYEEISGINSETLVFLKEMTTSIKISESMLGRVLDFQGNPIDDLGPLMGPFTVKNIYGEPINPLHRPPITSALDTGIHAINSFLTIGKGQRMAIMAGSGVGKSVLLGMIGRNTKVDLNVIALIGERGREVLEFIKEDLGEEGLKKSVIIVATSDSSPLLRLKAAYSAMTIAEYFRDKNRDVLFMMDSITRFAMASREISLSSGEPPGQKGYTPSVFARMPKILERAGTKINAGSITGIYTVLVEGGDLDEPVTDSVRSIVDGHIILTRELAEKNHFPAIDILKSISRVMNKVVSKEHKLLSSYLRDLLSLYKTNEDLITVGAYVKGTNIKVDKAICIYDDLTAFLKQEIDQSSTIEELYDQMVEMVRKAENSANPVVIEDKSIEIKLMNQL